MKIPMSSAIESIKRVPGSGDVYKYMRCSPGTIEDMKLRRESIVQVLKIQGESSTYDLMAFHDEPEKNIRNDITALVEQGLVKKTVRKTARKRFVFYSAVMPRVSL